MESNDSGTIAHDPVCGMDVEIASAQNKADYRGQTYYFCSRGCMLEFQDDPEKYLDPSYVPMGMDGH